MNDKPKLFLNGVIEYHEFMNTHINHRLTDGCYQCGSMVDSYSGGATMNIFRNYKYYEYHGLFDVPNIVYKHYCSYYCLIKFVKYLISHSKSEEYQNFLEEVNKKKELEKKLASDEKDRLNRINRKISSEKKLLKEIEKYASELTNRTTDFKQASKALKVILTRKEAIAKIKRQKKEAYDLLRQQRSEDLNKALAIEREILESIRRRRKKLNRTVGDCGALWNSGPVCSDYCYEPESADYRSPYNRPVSCQTMAMKDYVVFNSAFSFYPVPLDDNKLTNAEREFLLSDNYLDDLEVKKDDDGAIVIISDIDNNELDFEKNHWNKLIDPSTWVGMDVNDYDADLQNILEVY